MSKWELSEAAKKRVQKRVEKILIESEEVRFDAWEVMQEAVKPEDFAQPRRTIEKILEFWIMEGVLPGFCSRAFDRVCFERREIMEAAESISNGLRTFQDYDL